MLRRLNFQYSYTPSDDPLHTFYIPTLSASVRYDRMAGFFSSTALAVAAAGVAHLIAGGGQMRLLVGAQLAPEDVEAIRQGHDLQEVVAARLDQALPQPDDLADQLMRDRLTALAWMVAAGALEIRVVLPKGPDGLPLPADAAREYFHPKVGIFTDTEGNQVAFSGSVNESEAGWRYNYEQFLVFRSWTEEGRVYIAELVGRFERLWSNQEPDWIGLPIPEAARLRLLRYTPPQPPARDPLERAPAPVRERAVRITLAPDQERERILCRFLRDLPHLLGAEGLGMTTSVITPWPHQQVVARRIVQTFPSRYLLADEVGLGKTVEVGLVLRELWLRGIVRRALILAPKSVFRQWQEELYEKFGLNVPVYDGTLFRDVHGEEHVPATPNPWDGVSLALVSSQLVKRRERRETLLDARPWDLVVVDEAHHARRRDFLDLSRYRPNRMLELLNRLQTRTRGLLLLTATPMQVHPVEVWDLLNLLGLSGPWGADEKSFLRFYEELRLPFNKVDWSFVLRMVRAELEVTDGRLDPMFETRMRRELGLVDWERVRRLLEGHGSARRAVRDLPPKAKTALADLTRRHTPLRRLVFRNTRNLLREYARRGLLRDRVPTRDPKPVWVPMRDEERALYDRIEEYITHFYRKYEGERKGLGFVMTVYRRRLTSSFYAVQRSLERRLAFLQGQADLGLEEDLEQEALSLDADELIPADRSLFRDEIAYVEDFLRELSMLGGLDSKVARLLEDLQAFFRQRETALVFTQYTDTMDFLREQLRQTYGPHVACYSGRGGERWDGVMWVPASKEEIKNAFRAGEIKVLVCTEAASEGLNLQTCGVLINYDMPWNPMRVEQRIGRVDRIGQRYDEVWVRNYFYEGTVEAQVYGALSRRIGLFETVVGPLQPILAHVEQTIERAAMAPIEEREQVLQEELERIEAELDHAAEGLNLDEWAEKAEEVAPADTPVALAEMGALLIQMPTLTPRFRPHETISGAFWLRLEDGEVAVTFDPAVFDAHPYTLQFLTFGHPLLDRLLAEVSGDDGETVILGPLLRLAVDTPLHRVGYYVLDAEGRPRPIRRLSEAREALEGTGSEQEWSEAAIEAAREDLEKGVQAEWNALQRAGQQIRRVKERTQAARAAHLLVRAALVELALGQQPDFSGREAYPSAFDKKAVLGLKRHGYPWTALLRIAHDSIEPPRPTDPFFVEIQGEPRSRLEQRFQQIEQDARQLLGETSVESTHNKN